MESDVLEGKNLKDLFIGYQYLGPLGGPTNRIDPFKKIMSLVYMC